MLFIGNLVLLFAFTPFHHIMFALVSFHAFLFDSRDSPLILHLALFFDHFLSFGRLTLGPGTDFASNSGSLFNLPLFFRESLFLFFRQLRACRRITCGSCGCYRRGCRCGGARRGRYCSCGRLSRGCCSGCLTCSFLGTTSSSFMFCFLLVF